MTWTHYLACGCDPSHFYLVALCFPPLSPSLISSPSIAPAPLTPWEGGGKSSLSERRRTWPAQDRGSSCSIKRALIVLARAGDFSWSVGERENMCHERRGGGKEGRQFPIPAMGKSSYNAEQEQNNHTEDEVRAWSNCRTPRLSGSYKSKKQRQDLHSLTTTQKIRPVKKWEEGKM